MAYERPVTQHTARVHDDSFYFSELVTFEVEGTLFRVLRQQFSQNSEHFRDVFSMPVGEGNIAEGTSDHNPIVLPDKKADFKALLKYFYPEISGQVKTLEEWISVFQLSHKYSMDSIYLKATRILASMELPPIRRFQLAAQHPPSPDLGPRGDPLKRAAIVSLCQSPQSLSISDANEIGPALTLAICKVREQKPPPASKNKEWLIPDLASVESLVILMMVNNVLGERHILEGTKGLHALFEPTS